MCGNVVLRYQYTSHELNAYPMYFMSWFDIAKRGQWPAVINKRTIMMGIGRYLGDNIRRSFNVRKIWGVSDSHSLTRKLLVTPNRMEMNGPLMIWKACLALLHKSLAGGVSSNMQPFSCIATFRSFGAKLSKTCQFTFIT